MGTTYAIDFVPVDDRGRSAPRTWRSALTTEPPETFVGFNATILAPLDGTVVLAHDGERDHEARRSTPTVTVYALTQGRRMRAGSSSIRQLRQQHPASRAPAGHRLPRLGGCPRTSDCFPRGRLGAATTTPRVRDHLGLTHASPPVPVCALCGLIRGGHARTSGGSGVIGARYSGRTPAGAHLEVSAKTCR